VYQISLKDHCNPSFSKQEKELIERNPTEEHSSSEEMPLIICG
jgi:hypothetical protein